MSLEEQLSKVREEREDCAISIKKWQEKYLKLETESEELRTKINELAEAAKCPESVDVIVQTEPETSEVRSRPKKQVCCYSLMFDHGFGFIVKEQMIWWSSDYLYKRYIRWWGEKGT